MNDEAATHHPVISLLSRDYSHGVYNTHCGEKCQDWNPILKFKANAANQPRCLLASAELGWLAIVAKICLIISFFDKCSVTKVNNKGNV